MLFAGRMIATAGRRKGYNGMTSKPFRFIERLVVLDSQKIDTLLVIPL